MSYLLDKKIKRKKFFTVTFFVIVLCILIYFRAGIFNGLSYAMEGMFRPVLIAGNSIGEKFRSLGSYFVSKNSLYLQNENLKSQILESAADRANYISVVDENNKMKEILGRIVQGSALHKMTLAAILSKPNQSLYDTLIIDAGTAGGIKIGNIVFALGDVPIGRVEKVYEDSSKVILFSNPGEITEVVISKPAGTAGGDVFMQAVGRGGGNFEMTLVKDFILEKGTPVVLRGITPYVLATVETTLSDPRDSFQKALLVSPVNIQELKFVEVQIAP